MPSPNPAGGEPSPTPTHRRQLNALGQELAQSGDDTVTFSPTPVDGGPPRVQTASPTPPPADQPSSVLGAIGSCNLLEEISRGGMGVVYRARQRTLGRIVAVKVILDGTFCTSDQVLRFNTEAQAAANLNHANIAAIYEYGEHQGRPYLVMEYIDGGSLTEWRQAEDRYDEYRIAELVRRIALAVEHAHQQGVIHRDLKPSNVLVDRQGQPHVVDFGLAKLAGQDSTLTAAGAVLGTPSYMAPEQASASPAQVGPAADVYGLGAILYELLTGRPPFRAETLAATIAQVETQPPVPPRFLNPAISRDLEAVCLKCLEKSPANRYATPRAMADELDRNLQGARVLARRRIGVVPLTRKLALIAALAGAVGGAAVAVSTTQALIDFALAGFGGAILSMIVVTAIICLWNELALPAWLLSRTAHPLGKTAFGLGLILFSLVLTYPTTYLWTFPNIQSESAESFKSFIAAGLAVLRAATLVGIFGKLFCLAASFSASAQGPLMWSICADLLALAIGLRVSQADAVGSGASLLLLRTAPWLSLLGVVLFVLAMQRSAKALDEPQLNQRRRWLIIWLSVICPALFLGGLGGRFVAHWMDVGFGVLYFLAWFIGLVRLARLVSDLQGRALQRI